MLESIFETRRVSVWINICKCALQNWLDQTLLFKYIFNFYKKKPESNWYSLDELIQFPSKYKLSNYLVIILLHRFKAHLLPPRTMHHLRIRFLSTIQSVMIQSYNIPVKHWLELDLQSRLQQGKTLLELEIIQTKALFQSSYREELRYNVIFINKTWLVK